MSFEVFFKAVWSPKMLSFRNDGQTRIQPALSRSNPGLPRLGSAGLKFASVVIMENVFFAPLGRCQILNIGSRVVNDLGRDVFPLKVPRRILKIRRSICAERCEDVREMDAILQGHI